MGIPFLACITRCCECVIGDDTFNRANSGNITSGSTLGWTKARGDAAINSNKLRITTADTVLFCDTESTTPRVRVTLGEINFSQNDDPFRFFFNIVDLDNWWALQIDAGTEPGAKIVQCVATVETELHEFRINTLISHTQVQTVRACITSFDQLVFSITSNGVEHDRGFYDITDLTSGKVGLGTSSTFSGTLDLDDFSLDRANNAAGETLESAWTLGLPDCQCISGVYGCGLNVKYPFTLRVVLAGIANGTCGTATDLNGTYDLEFFRSYLLGGVWITEWRITFAAICTFDELLVYMDTSGGGILEVQLNNTSTGGRITWDGFDTTTLDPSRCVVDEGDSTVSTNVADTSGPFGGNGAGVDESGSTATISIP